MRYKSFRYQAKSWTTPRRIVAKVEHHRGELFPRVGFIVTNMARPQLSVLAYNLGNLWRRLVLPPRIKRRLAGRTSVAASLIGCVATLNEGTRARNW